MTGAHPHLLTAGVVQPYVDTHSVTLLFWLMINLVAFAFEFNQWAVRRVEAKKTDRGSLAVLLSCTAAGADRSDAVPECRSGRGDPPGLVCLRLRDPDVPGGVRDAPVV